MFPILSYPSFFVLCRNSFDRSLCWVLVCIANARKHRGFLTFCVVVSLRAWANNILGECFLFLFSPLTFLSSGSYWVLLIDLLLLLVVVCSRVKGYSSSYDYCFLCWLLCCSVFGGVHVVAEKGRKKKHMTKRTKRKEKRMKPKRRKRWWT